MISTVTLQIPDGIYRRLEVQAKARSQSLEEILVHALNVNVGSPPDVNDVPTELKADLADLDSMSDDALLILMQGKKPIADFDRYDELLELKSDRLLLSAETEELDRLRKESDIFMLRKAQAAVLLKWRGYSVSDRLCWYFFEAGTLS